MCTLESGPVYDFSCPCWVSCKHSTLFHCCKLLLTLTLLSSPPGLQEEASRTNRVDKRWATQPSHPNHFILSVYVSFVEWVGGHLFISLPMSLLLTSTLWVSLNSKSLHLLVTSLLRCTTLLQQILPGATMC